MTRQEEIAAACAAEQDRISTMRLFAWSSAAQGDEVADKVTLLPLTFQGLIDLKIAECPFFTGGEVSRHACLNYLWRVSSLYTSGSDSAERRALLDRALAAYEDKHLRSLCESHIEVAFLDRPFGGGSASSSALPAVEPVISNLYEVCKICHLTPEAALEWSLAKGFAMIRAHYRATDSDYSAPIPERLDHYLCESGRELQRQMDNLNKDWSTDAE